MEGLHLLTDREVLLGHFSGAVIGSPYFTVSLLFYADDAIIVNKWDMALLDRILLILDSFHEADGLAVNMVKSSLFGIRVSDLELTEFTSFAGCIKGYFPFIYLGLPMGVSMKLVANWKSLEDKYKKKLSGWKVSLLSIGGLLTLVKSVLDYPRDLRGSSGGVDGSVRNGSTTWVSIVNVFLKLKSQVIIPSNVLRVKVGNDRATRFWYDNWRDGYWTWELARLEIGPRNMGLVHELEKILGKIVSSSDEDRWNVDSKMAVHSQGKVVVNLNDCDAVIVVNGPASVTGPTQNWAQV
ncbi:uncharacterized protein [Rutidosis leptorrhynchoides]|uniref:uncharacterized protein n=1 Tax=Rutidosis leptorrhynchoides TaxID=125765 RepID=UPI003A998B74